MSVRAYVLIEADQTRVDELREGLPEIELEGSQVLSVSVISGPYDLIALVESSDIAQLGR